MAGPGTSAAPCPIACEVNRVTWVGKLDHDIGIAMSGSVARAMIGIPCTACSVTEGTGIGGMIAVSPCNIREYGSIRPAATSGGSVARTATIAGRKFDVACPAIRRRAHGNGIHSYPAAVRMASADDASGEWSCPGC